MKYDENWVMARRNPRHGLAPLQEVLAATGSPQQKLKIIHVAGTNGKGSVCNDLNAILTAAGHCTGMFTSPHLISHRDRIRIGTAWISKDEFEAYLERFHALIEEKQLGMFEIDLLIALHWFADRKTDFAIIETGIGGRLDNTNALGKTELSIITSIGFDHMEILGSRIQQIAFEKAGIIKPYGHCLSGMMAKPAASVIRQRAWLLHAALHTVKVVENHDTSFVFEGVRYTVQGGLYQKQNAALALAGAKYLGVRICDPKIIDALAQASWPGRFETVKEDPRVILDGAHNPAGIQALITSLDALKGEKTIVYSALKDKAFLKMAALLKGHCERLIITTFSDERAMADLGSFAGYEVIPDYREALAAAEALHRTVIVTGSLHFISAVRVLYMEQQ